MIKKIQIELVLIILIIINISLSNRLDLAIYNYFYNLNYGFETFSLKNFFIGITELGDSFWYFLVFLLVFLITFVGKATKILSSESYLRIRNFTIFGFFYLLLVGFVTQILKHVIGRPRPNHTNFEEGVVFNFFSTDSSFHSFPSGHSSTIISVAILLGLLIPNLRKFFIIFSIIVAISRVVVGAHYLTDIIAGGLVAIILYKILKAFIKKRYPIFFNKRFQINNNSLLLRTNIVFITIGIFLTAGSALDIFVSGFFYKGADQFFLQSYDALSFVFREFLLPLLALYIFIMPIISIFVPINQIYFGHRFRLKEIVFIWVSGAITLILVVNIFLKNMWGRARPNEIQQFGGNDLFTPWFSFGDSCFSNCSFVSGDASVGFASIVFYFITKNNFFIYMSIFFGLSLGFIRIIAGGHFLSDIIFAQIVVTAMMFIFFIIYKRVLND